MARRAVKSKSKTKAKTKAKSSRKKTASPASKSARKGAASKSGKKSVAAKTARPRKQRPIELYYWPTPNGWKISIMLEECGLPYIMKPVNISVGDQFKIGYFTRPQIDLRH